jgi:hypothetical protein
MAGYIGDKFGQQDVDKLVNLLGFLASSSPEKRVCDDGILVISVEDSANGGSLVQLETRIVRNRWSIARLVLAPVQGTREIRQQPWFRNKATARNYKADVGKAPGTSVFGGSLNAPGCQWPSLVFKTYRELHNQ